MITYVKSVTAWVKMSVDQYLLYGITDSYFFRACKVQTFKNILSNQRKLKFNKELAKKDKLPDNHMKSTKQFIYSVVYAGESSENYVVQGIGIVKNKNKNIYGYPARL